MSDLPDHYLSAKQVLDKFRKKEVSPVELNDVILARAEQVDGKINAFSHTFFDEARDQAKKAEYAYMNGTARPLEGLLVGMKDEFPVNGQPNTNGSLLWKDHVEDYTSPVPQRVLDAGGIIHARTTTPEFSASIVTWSRLHGVTRNPWNLNYCVGGSSGGSGASLAAGTSILATGSDIGGSIRIPAGMNGVIGYRPPIGRVPDSPPFSQVDYATNGPLARTIQDTILLQNVLCGPDIRDHTSLPERYSLPKDYNHVKGLRIAYSYDLGLYPPEDSVR